MTFGAWKKFTVNIFAKAQNCVNDENEMALDYPDNSSDEEQPEELENDAHFPSELSSENKMDIEIDTRSKQNFNQIKSDSNILRTKITKNIKAKSIFS